LLRFHEVKAVLLLTFFFCGRALAEDPKVTALVVQGDAEERAHHTRAALSAFRAAEQIEPRNPGVLLRISKQYSDLIEETKPEAVARTVAQKALNYALRAVEIDPNSAKAHLSVAVSYGKLTDFVGSKTKVEYSRLVRDETLRSIELDPTDDFAWHVLGRWHQGVANVSGVLKALAKVVYGGLPPASNEEAVRCMKKAIELAPQRLIHHSELARIYKAMHKPDLATKEWQTILDLAVRDKGDEKDLAEARQELRVTSTIGKDR
jgi:tetratricopeptide (TPR) repeat protein